MVKWNGTEWNNYINFRDYLNVFPEKAKIYDELKQELAIQFPKERRQYTEGKQQLIDKFLQEAMRWRVKR